MRHSVGGKEDLAGLERGTEEDIAGFVTGAISEDADELKADWREQIVSARLGTRLSQTIRSKVYPTGQNSVDAAAVVRTTAPKIIGAYALGATIRPVNGARYLWLPTDDVPKKRQGNALTSEEVEARYGRQLTIIHPGSGALKTTPSRLHNGVAYAGYRNLAIRKASGRWRNATLKEAIPGGRSYRESTRQFVIMFTLVPLVTVKRRPEMDLDALARAAEGRYPVLLSKHWS